jgi:hypothetical protein
VTKSEIQGFYERSTTKANTTPDPSEFRGWVKTLEMFVAADLQNALDDWWAGNRWLPTAKDLLPLAITARNARAARASQKQHFVVWRCGVCHVTRSGFVSPQDHAPRSCKGFSNRPGRAAGEICGGNMTEIHRESGEASPALRIVANGSAGAGKMAAARDY